MRRLASAAAVSLLLATLVSARQTPATTLELGASAFESYLELLRQQAGIPGISGVLIQEGAVVWERGLGFANQEARIPATPTTPYVVADLTQVFTAVLLLQCVEERRLTLDEPLRSYGVSLPEATATLRQVLSHTPAAATDGSFRYDPARYAQLAAAVEHCAPQPFRKSVAHRLLERLAMIDSVPGRDLQQASVVPDALADPLFEPEALARYAGVLERIAVPYRVDGRKSAARNEVAVDGINAATGLVSTVRDLVRFNAALDDGILLREETLAAAWSPTRLPDGTASPMGLGWFVQTYRGTRVVWHFGVVPQAYSALFIKVPARRATLILLANSDGLAIPFELEAGDVSRSPFGTLFLRMLL
ncbi:MAG: serine hydrolase domain-containing protein [Vicinamibacterales bacterium]